MKKTKNTDLERLRPLFFLLGISISLSLFTVAFEWRSYGEKKADTWIPVEELIDTVTPPKLIKILPIQKKTTTKQIKQKQKSNIIKEVQFEIKEFLESNKKIKNSNDSDLDDFENEDDEIENLAPLPFLPDMASPENKPYFLNGRCRNLESNIEKYRCSMKRIHNVIQNNLYTPSNLISDQNFTIHFKIDTSGYINNIKVVGIRDKAVIQSATKLLTKLPPMVPPVHNKEKRVMITSIKVKIQRE